MSKEKDDFSKDVESIFRKTVEINKQYLKQSTALFKEFGSSGRELKNFNLLQPETMMGAFTSFTKMNLDHYKNMMDLGFALTKKAFDPAATDATNEEDDSPEEPSFVLSATTFPGGMVDFQFILDNDKKEQAVCQLVNSEYVDETKPDNSQSFLTTFRPQAFQLAPGISQTVHINISINKDINLGTYQSKVQVLGFEPSYFLITLTIAEKPDNSTIAKPIKKTGNGRQTKQRPKKE